MLPSRVDLVTRQVSGGAALRQYAAALIAPFAQSSDGWHGTTTTPRIEGTGSDKTRDFCLTKYDSAPQATGGDCPGEEVTQAVIMVPPISPMLSDRQPRLLEIGFRGAANY